MKIKAQMILRNNFPAFARHLFFKQKGKKLASDPPYVELVCTRLQATLWSHRNLLINEPPRHLKTFLASNCFPAWVLGRQPSTQIMVVTYGEIWRKRSPAISRDFFAPIVIARCSIPGSPKVGKPISGQPMAGGVSLPL